MKPDKEWYRNQSEHNKTASELLHANRSDLLDWTAAMKMYSALHRADYRFAARTGRVPRSHAERNRRIWDEIPAVHKDYRDLYLPSLRTRYCDGHRLKDSHRVHAARLPALVEKALPFP